MLSLDSKCYPSVGGEGASWTTMYAHDPGTALGTFQHASREKGHSELTDSSESTGSSSGQ